MEDKNNHPSLPSNYVTLAQLQERWLKQKEREEKQLQEEQQQQQQQQIPKLPQHNPPEHHRGQRPNSLQQTWRAISARPSEFRHAAVKRPQVESRPRNTNVPESNRVVVEVNRETNQSVEAKAEIGGGNDGQDGRKKQPKNKNRKKVKPKPRADTEKKQTESTMVENKEVANSDVKRIDEKTETKIELNGSKSDDLIVEVEQKLGAVSMNSENEKQNSRKKTYDSSRGSRRNNGGRNYRSGPYGRADKHIKRLAEDAAQSVMVGNKEEANSNVQLVDDKRETKTELNGSKGDNLVSEVEQKLGTVSMNSEKEKLNSRVKTYDSSRGSQRNNGARNYSTGPYGRVDKESEKLAENAAQSTTVGSKEVANSDVHRVDGDKRETKIELNGSRSDNLMSEVEQKLGAISMNSENVKQNGRVRTYDGYRGFQRYNGGRNYRTGPYGGGFRAHEVQRRKVDQKIWVRKSEDSYGNVDHNEITSK